jgi:hypothetical protein
LLSVWREPQIGKRTAETMRGEVERAGFHIERDTATPEWALRLGANEPAGPTARLRRLLVARLGPFD